MNTIVDDNFSTYADGDLDSVGSAIWRRFATAHFGPLVVSSHALAPNALSLDGAEIVKSAAWGGSLTDQWVEITLGASGDYKGAGIFGEDTSHTSGNGYYMETTGSVVTIMKIIDGSFAGLWSSGSLTVAPGDVMFLSGHIVGGTSVDLELKQNGVSRVTGNDVAWLGGGIPFARMWYATAGSRITRFKAGDFTSPLPPSGGKPTSYYRQQRQR